MKNRKIFIDYLKLIGLLLVILAHVSPPVLINQLRSFDVPLLVLVSAYLARTSYKPESVNTYLWKRFKRLVIPAWIFTCVFLPIRIIFYSTPSLNELIKEITFQRDSDMLGFLWVIWVYLICACIIPVINKIKVTRKILIILSLFIIAYECICKTSLVENRYLYITLFTIVPYGFVTYIGYNLELIKRPSIAVIVSFLFYAFCAIVLYHIEDKYVQTDIYKYPAQLYYLSFAIGVSIALFFLLKNRYIPNNDVISFMSSSSLWIYLWHILALYAVKMFITDDSLWYLQYFLIVGIATTITYFQNLIADWLLDKYNFQFMKFFKG